MRSHDTPIRLALEKDWPGIERLLIDSELPLAGAREHLDAFLVAESSGAVIGCGALEIYGATALLRSVAVDPLDAANASASSWCAS